MYKLQMSMEPIPAQAESRIWWHIFIVSTMCGVIEGLPEGGEAVPQGGGRIVRTDLCQRGQVCLLFPGQHHGLGQLHRYTHLTRWNIRVTLEIQLLNAQFRKTSVSSPFCTFLLFV